ncbi:zinc finger MYND domain-containing protein [Phanerochaete sordida]|uniref:Zinc finger MYND domain-containing protein n=1 Tax=Phanerochaete sordida TaxID=48140 RepID=A0A9P3G8P2_9APHY|nr:zinc finger MYND domain-containing protein [Phanerochaete sordida]
MPPSNHRDLTSRQCQHCWKGKGLKYPNLKLSACAGCQVATYCSKECQRLAWPAHKDVCKRGQVILQADALLGLSRHPQTRIASLSKLVLKHRSELNKIAVLALDADIDPAHTAESVLWVVLRPARPTSVHTGWTWTPCATDVVPCSLMRPDHRAATEQEKRRLVQRERADGKEVRGVAVLVMQDEETAASTEVMFALPPTMTGLPRGPRRPDWRALLVEMLRSA